MRSIPGTITEYVRDRDQVEELDLDVSEVRALRRTKAELRVTQKEKELAEARAAVVRYHIDQVEGRDSV